MHQPSGGGGRPTLEAIAADQRRLERDTTPAYRPPELVRLLRDNEPVALDEKVDMWAVGCVVFALHFGRLPFPAGARNTCHQARTAFHCSLCCLPVP